VILVMELTGRDRSFILPMLLSVISSTLIARTLDVRSIYDARLTDRDIVEQQHARRPPAE